MTKKETKEEITLKNTKQEILDALNEALEREKAVKTIKYDPIKEVEEKKKETAITETKQNVKNNIFSAELNEKFNNLEIALKAEEEKLKTLYDIESELNNIIVVVNAGKDAIAKIESARATKEKEMTEKISLLEEEYENKLKELQSTYAEEEKRLKLERSREKEEYTYNLNREREINNNSWLDEKKKREEELSNREKETNQLFEEAKNKEKYLNELEEKVKSLPDMLEKEYTRGKKDATVEIEKENKYQVELLKKDFNNTIDRQNDKILSLENEIKNYIEMNKQLQEKLDKSYSEIKDMATRTVEANGNVKILNSNQEAKI